MAATDITANIKSLRTNGFPYPTISGWPVVSQSCALPFTAGTSDGVVWEGHAGDILVVWNTDPAVTKGVKLVSIANEHGRTGDLGPAEVPANSFWVLGPLAEAGFLGAGGTGKFKAIADTGDHTLIKFAVIRP